MPFRKDLPATAVCAMLILWACEAEPVALPDSGPLANSSTSSVDGTGQLAEFVARDAISDYFPGNIEAGEQTILSITSFPQACESVKSAPAVNSRLLHIWFTELIGPGEYSTSERTVQAYAWVKLDASGCDRIGAVYTPLSGDVTITRASGYTFEGSLEMSGEGIPTVSGTFVTTRCPGLWESICR
jgi:hypothetical protein